MKRQIGKGLVTKWVMGAAILAAGTGLAGQAGAQPLPPLQGPDWRNMTPEQLLTMMRERPEQARDMMQNLTPEQLQDMAQNLPPGVQMQMQMTPEQVLNLVQNLPPGVQQQMMKDLPPEQREIFQQAQARLREGIQTQRMDWIRQTLVASGYTDVAVQDAVIAFIQAQEKARQPLRARAQALSTLLVKPDAPADQLKQQLAEFRELVKKDDERYKQELLVLDEKIKYSTQLRLETLLTLLGVVGQETSTLGGAGVLFPDSPMANTQGAG